MLYVTGPPTWTKGRLPKKKPAPRNKIVLHVQAFAKNQPWYNNQALKNQSRSYLGAPIAYAR